ncbi:MAG: hypothetical protein QM736_05960 [Vicinamibacterales bacterium]
MFQPEAVPLSDEALMWNLQSWGKLIPTEVDPPRSAKLKWLEPRHMTNIENRWGRDRANDFHYIFFNGTGYNAWENIWGVWNQFTPRDADDAAPHRGDLSAIPGHVVSMDWEPYAHHLQHNVFASMFPTRALDALDHRQSQRIRSRRRSARHRPPRRPTYYDLGTAPRSLRLVKDDQPPSLFPRIAAASVPCSPSSAKPRPGKISALLARARSRGLLCKPLRRVETPSAGDRAHQRPRDAGPRPRTAWSLFRRAEFEFS